MNILAIPALAMALATPATPPPHQSPAPALKALPVQPTSLTLYDADGEQVAACSIDRAGDDVHLVDCKINDGFTLDDLMNAWVRAAMLLEGGNK